VSWLLPLLAQLPLGPGSTGDVGLPPWVLVGLLVLGFATAVTGHVVRSQTAVVCGIALIFVVTAIVPALLFLTS
jgi:hypothetical protein